MRMLVLHHEGAPIGLDAFPGPIRKVILDHPDDDADLWSVWEVYPAGSLAPSRDITEQFAMTWAMEIPFGDGIEPHDYLAPFPAFIRAAAEPKMIAKWQSQHALQHIDYVPAPLKRIA